MPFAARRWPAVLAFLLVAASAHAEDLTPRSWLVLPPVGRGGRLPFPPDALAARIAAGDWRGATAGDALTLPDSTSRAWTEARPDPDGTLRHPALRGGYALWTLDLPAARTMLLEASHHSVAIVNGEPRTGDLYGYGWVRLPVRLNAGHNWLLFACARGAVRARLVGPPAPLSLDVRDATLPDLPVGRSSSAWAAVVVLNATERERRDLRIVATAPGGRVTVSRIAPVGPLTVRKVRFRVAARPQQAGDLRIDLTLRDGARVLDRSAITIRARAAGASRRVTFVSGIDGSVQYYAVQPAPPTTGREARALVLSLHGAGVEAIGQADAYAPKSWCHIVAPTNRRPFGFDWEDWGRLDALEVLDHARRELGTDPARTYLTGHSMGGHGAWHLGLSLPDLFAAIAPSAGWASFATYGGAAPERQPGPVQALLQRAASPSDTYSLVRNALGTGVYVLHGDADDNVPVAESRRMRAILEPFHRDLHWHEQAGAGHWWDISDEPGADCVDWPPIFDLFARRRLPEAREVRELEFVTANPGIAATRSWATIEAQQRALVPSSVRLRCDPHRRRVSGETANVLRLSLDLAHLPPGEPVQVALDGAAALTIAWPAHGARVWLERAGNAWRAAAPPSPDRKGPARSGPFKDAYRHRFVLVYGTRGTPEENAWAYARARFDAEVFWYRGNGSPDVVADTDFDPRRERDRGVVVYGNADTNAAWSALLGASPIQVRGGVLRVGERELRGAALACLIVRPRPGSAVASVAVVSGTGVHGMRLTDRLPVFVSGVAYPDWVAFGPEAVARGWAGVLGAGFFGDDWSLEGGEAAWLQ
ncbi:MAG TPA: prolyl oligopeptidase family serine peptidase [Chthonomonadales bacterium]|nr:prolyl oligopeptidase family serine peptidase [Chthonomonadales bacterium]